MKDLSDIEWCSIDVLMAARKAGLASVSRHELLYGESAIPQTVRVRIVWTLLLLSNGPLVSLQNEHDFSVTPEGVQLYALRWGAKAEPHAVDVICLPDLSGGTVN